MEADSFLKILQNRQRNLTKKIERIRKKQAEVKASGKEIKEEERKMIESAPQVEELLAETEKLTQAYSKHLESTQKDQKKPVPKVEEDRSNEVISLWLLGEFLSQPQIKEKFIKENPSENDLEAFLLLHSQVKGHAGDKLSEIQQSFEKSVELYLQKSDKIASGTMRSYRKLYEFVSRGLVWASHQVLPEAQVKNLLSVQSEPVYSAQPTEKVVEEVKQEVNVEGTNKWGEQQDDVWEDGPKAENKEGGGFVEVTGKKPRGGSNQRAQGYERQGRGGRRGRGERGSWKPRGNKEYQQRDD